MDLQVGLQVELISPFFVHHMIIIDYMSGIFLK